MKGPNPPEHRSNSRSGVLRTMRAARPRDDLREAFAGNENKGPSGSKVNQGHSTNVKSRRTRASSKKTPIR
jgi:hypothetical protein